MPRRRHALLDSDSLDLPKSKLFRPGESSDDNEISDSSTSTVSGSTDSFSSNDEDQNLQLQPRTLPVASPSSFSSSLDESSRDLLPVSCSSDSSEELLNENPNRFIPNEGAEEQLGNGEDDNNRIHADRDADHDEGGNIDRDVDHDEGGNVDRDADHDEGGNAGAVHFDRQGDSSSEEPPISDVDTEHETSSESDDTESASDTELDSDTVEEEENPIEQALFPGSSLFSNEFNSILLAMSQRHNFSSQAMGSILKLFHMALPEDNTCPTSTYKFEKSLSELGYSFTKHSTCFKCQHLLQNTLCSNGNCCKYGYNGNGRDSSLFYVIDLLPELERLISENFGHMQSYVNNYIHQDGVFKDILDGQVYQRQIQHARADGSFCITLYWHLDGAPALKSRNMSLWPIQSFVAELPPSLRYSFKNILLSGLWYGPKKPEMQVFQHRFVEEIKVLQKGFEVEGTQTKFKVVVNGQVADLMAKGPSINCKIHNGKFGCSVCLHPGRRLAGPGNKRVYEYIVPAPPKRIHNDFLTHANLAEQTGEAVFGVKGISPVHDIIEIPETVLLDYMHQVLEGEYTRRFNKWLTGTCPSDFHLSNIIKEDLSRDLLSVGLPHDFKRKLRPIEDFKKWKASEKQVLFLHVGLPLMKKHLHSELFYHHCLLITGVRLLCENNITNAEICIANAMLVSYTRLLPTLFDVKEATYNSHSLTHLGDQVIGHGPLILHSGFVFESMLAHLKRMFHGTRGIPDQIIKKLAITQHATGHILNNVQDESAKELAKQLIDPHDLKSSITLNDGIKFIPPLQQQIPDVRNPVEGFPAETDNLRVAHRMIKEGQIYHCSNYVRKKTSVSSLVQFREGEQTCFGKIEYFVKDGNDGFAVVNVLRNLQFNVSQRGLPEPIDSVIREFLTAGYLGMHFTAVQKTDLCKFIKCTYIMSRIVFVENGDNNVDGYVSVVLDSYQHD